MAERKRAQQSDGHDRSHRSVVGSLSRTNVRAGRVVIAGGLAVGLGFTALSAAQPEAEIDTVAAAPRSDVVGFAVAETSTFVEDLRSTYDEPSAVSVEVIIEGEGAEFASAVQSVEPAPPPVVPEPVAPAPAPAPVTTQSGGGGSTGSESQGSSSSDAPVSKRGETSAVLAEAEKYIGVPYAYGGKNPSQGFDCSGFTAYVMSQLGYNVPSASGVVYSQAQSGNLGRLVSADELQPGDLMVWRAGDGGNSGHTAFYAGNGMFIDSSRPGVPVDYRPISRPNAAAPLYVRFID